METKENKKHIVYMHVNKINNKIYVGQTCLEPERRWRNGGYGYKNCTYFWKAIQKYGWDNFEHIIFASNLTQEEANKIERLLIALYDTNNIDKGYNLTAGGDAAFPSDYTRERISMNHADVSGSNNPFYGKKHTDETKEKISKANKNRFAGDKNPMYGVHRFGENAPGYQKGKEVVQLDIDYNYIQEYITMTDTANKNGLHVASIHRCCAGTQQTCGGYRWRYKFDWEAEHEKRMEY